MAVFFHDNRSIAYRIEFAPFEYDLLLLQSSSFNSGFWNQVTRDLSERTNAGGRIVTCEWHDAGVDSERLSRDLLALISTLGLHEIRVMACGDAVKVVEKIAAEQPSLFTKTLFYRDEALPSGGLTKAVTEALQI